MIECTPNCKYKKLLEECEGKRQQEKNNELHKCKESNKVKERKLRDLNKKVITLTIIATVAGTLIGKEALEVIGQWLGMLEDFNLGGGGGNTVGVFPAPGTLAVFALYPLVCRAGRRK
tara:strand:+ start:394 stop:747 length:354 start_codon:yes stop_codon:yes gene_type:complete